MALEQGCTCLSQEVEGDTEDKVKEEQIAPMDLGSSCSFREVCFQEAHQMQIAEMGIHQPLDPIQGMGA